MSDWHGRDMEIHNAVVGAPWQTSGRRPVAIGEEISMEESVKEANALKHIERLVAEEHRLFAERSLSDDERARLQEIQVKLDQCWDLLRQRRAAVETGQDPAEAQLRPPEVVEKYTG